MRMLCGAAIAIGLAQSAGAGPYFSQTFDGSGFTIPDNDPAGASSTIQADPFFFVIFDVSVTLRGLSHAWAGDLTMRLTSMTSGQSVTLVERVGRPSDAGFGDSSNFDGDYTFRDAGADLWAAAAALPGSGAIPEGAYAPSGLFNAPASLQNAFIGQSNGGGWVLTISDAAELEIGSLQSWSITFRYLPSPSGVSVIACAWMVAGRRRR